MFDIRFIQGDKFETLIKGEDIRGMPVKKGAVVVLLEPYISKGMGVKGAAAYHLYIRGVTTEGQLIDWVLDSKSLKALEK